MKRVKDILVVMVGISLMMSATGELTYAQPTGEQLNTLRSAKTVRIIVEQSYGEAEGVTLPFENIARKVLEDLKVAVVGANVKDYDATLKIEVKGTASGSRYSPYGTYYYTGADLSGWVGWEIPDDPNFSYKKFFQGGVSPPSQISGGGPTTPSGAPFYEAFQGSNFVVMLLETMVNVYGPGPLVTVLKDADSDVRGATAKVLGETVIKDPRAIEPLIAALKDKGWVFRRNVVEVLGDIKDPRAVEPLIEALKKDEEWLVRRSAAEALGKIKDPRAVESFIAALKDKDWGVRWRAAKALGEINDASAVEPLIVALKDGDKKVRRQVAEALKEIKDPRAIEPLIDTLNDKDSGVADVASWALGNITGRDFGRDPVKWQAWWDKNKNRVGK